MMMVLLVKFINFDNFFSAAALFLSFINQTKYIFREIEWRRREKREEKRTEETAWIFGECTMWKGSVKAA